ncbi:MAG: DUF3556 domain-containing protein, partial [Solirubrobacterales bacterium]|nr:DUF3556 domain-containing protein [Solirubrobacterales bacterium]
MGFLQPAPPPFDLQEWRDKPYLERLKANCQDWAVNGFGTPDAVFLLYAVKLVVYVVGAFFVISITTPGLGSITDIGDWWTQPIVFQKFVTWTFIWEILGLGSGSMQLTARYGPVIGGVLFWLRTGTNRLPPWPDRVPLTRGYRRTLVDVGLYAAVLGAGIYLLVSSGELIGVSGVRRLEPGAIAVLLGLWVLLGLRDKVSFLAGRPEIYGFFLTVSLFPAHNLIVAWQFVMLFIWWGAATSKLNRHFPYVISVMVSNTPWNRSRRMKASLYRAYPDDLRPGRNARLGAHLGTAVEYILPAVLIISRGGTIGTIALVGMIIFHVHIFSTFALGVPMEWNLFMIFGLLFLFGHYGSVPFSTLSDPLLIALLVVGGVVVPVLGNLFPEKISFLPGMRYYAGNWATSLWLFRKTTRAEERLDERACTVARITIEQLAKLYDREIAEYFLEKGLAFRSMHSHGRALNGLAARAVSSVDDYNLRDGEIVSGIINGWNFGDGHFHDDQLIAAVQERCEFAEDDLRVVVLEGQPIHRQKQHYWIYDAAAGVLEEGWVDVAEMVKRGPWLEESYDFPVEVVGSSLA